MFMCARVGIGVRRCSSVYALAFIWVLRWVRWANEWVAMRVASAGRFVYIEYVCVRLFVQRAGFGFSACCTGGPRQTSDAMDF